MNLQWTTLNTPQLPFCRIAFQLFNRDKSEGGLQRTMLPVDRGEEDAMGVTGHTHRGIWMGYVIDIHIHRKYPSSSSSVRIRLSVSCPIHRTTRLIEEGMQKRAEGVEGGMYHSASNNGWLGEGETLNAWWDSFCEGRFCPGGCWSFCGIVMKKEVGCSVCDVGMCWGQWGAKRMELFEPSVR